MTTVNSKIMLFSVLLNLRLKSQITYINASHFLGRILMFDGF